MGVDQVDLSLPDRGGHPPGDAPVAARPAVQAHQVGPLAEHLLADAADRVEAEDRRGDAAGEPADHLPDEHLGPGHLHDVEHESDAERAGHAGGRVGAGYGPAGPGYG